MPEIRGWKLRGRCSDEKKTFSPLQMTTHTDADRWKHTRGDTQDGDIPIFSKKKREMCLQDIRKEGISLLVTLFTLCFHFRNRRKKKDGGRQRCRLGLNLFFLIRSKIWKMKLDLMECSTAWRWKCIKELVVADVSTKERGGTAGNFCARWIDFSHTRVEQKKNSSRPVLPLAAATSNLLKTNRTLIRVFDLDLVNSRNLNEKNRWRHWVDCRVKIISRKRRKMAAGVQMGNQWQLRLVDTWRSDWIIWLLTNCFRDDERL